MHRGRVMTDRTEFWQLLRRLYAARVAGQLEQLCGLFADDAYFRIAGTSDGKPIAVAARGTDDIRTWLAMMVKTFRLNNYQSVTTLIDGTEAAVRWQADIHSRITGTRVRTELVDLVQTRDAHIVSYIEFF